jgi:HK97 family phage prohead protease
MPPEIPTPVYASMPWQRDIDVHAADSATTETGDASTKAAAVPRSITAQLATYGTVNRPQSAWGIPVRLMAGALETPAEANAVKFLRDHDPARVIGAMTTVEASAAGLRGTFRIGRTQDADEGLALAEDGILDSVSVGYAVHDAAFVVEADEEILNVTRASLFEVSLVGRPADSAARIDSVTARKADPMTIAPTETVPVPQPEGFTPAQLDSITAHLRDHMAPLAAAPITPPQIGSTRIVGVDGKPVVLATERRDATVPTAWGRDGKPYTAGDYLAAYAAASIPGGSWAREQEIRAALADEITTDVPGLLPVAIIGELLGRASGRRPVWESLSPRDMPMSGAKFDRPRITQHVLVGDRGAEKTNPPSQKFKVTLDEVAKKVFAGGLDVSNEALDWTSPSLLNELVLDFTRIYAAWTDTYASTQLLAAATTGAQFVTWDGTAAKLMKALADAAVLVANGVDVNMDAFPNTAWISLDVWAQLAGLTDTTGRPLLPAIGPMNAFGTMDVSDPTSGPAGTGFRWVVGRRLAASTIIGDRDFTEAYENGRRLLQAQNVPQLGLDIATMGYGATYFPFPKALVKIGPTPPPLAADVEPKATK